MLWSRSIAKAPSGTGNQIPCRSHLVLNPLPETENKQSISPRMSHSGRILVVDDDPRWLKSLSHMLSAAGYEVLESDSGEHALAAVADGLPDLVLLDIRMPGMDGFEVLRRLKAREESQHIPILMISAFAEREARDEGLRLGAVDSVTKPFHAGELLARVRMQMELAHLRAEHAGRTAELKSANENLEAEISRRQQVEEALQTRLLALTHPLDSLEDIRFSDLINLDDLQQLQDQFSNATGVASIITQPDGTPITKPSNFCRLCSEVIRKTEIGCRNCYQSDAALGVPCPSGPIIQPCLSGGLWDAGASITVGGKHIANWLIGQVRNEAQNEEQMLRYADEIGADREEFRQALAEVPVMSKARFEQTAQALFTFARQISSQAYQNVQQARFITGRRQAEEALRESETNLALTLQSIGDAVIATDAEGRITRMNPVAERLTGWSFAEAESRSIVEVFRIVNAGTREPVEDPAGQVIASGATVGLANHTVLLALDGREYQIADSAALIRDPSGKLLGVVLVFRDVTERYEAEVRIARLTQIYSALSQCNLDIVHSSSLEDLLPTFCRDVVEFGGLRMAWIGLVDEAAGLVRPAASYGEGREYIEGIQIPTSGDVATGRGPVGTSIRENHPVWCEDYQNDPSTAPWHERGARYGWVACAGLPLRRRGKTIGALAVYSDKSNALDEEVRKLLEEMADDISFAIDGFASQAERQLAEDALRESEERFRLMLQHIPSISVQGYHMDGTTHYWNDASEVLYGYPAREAIGKNLLDLIIPPEMKDGVRQAIKMMGETRQAIPASELTLVRKDGSRVTVYSSHAVIIRPGHEPEFFCIDIDLTERKLAEEGLQDLNAHLVQAKVRAEELAVKAESAALAKSEFLALMSHELRTPLNGVLGFAELLSKTRLDEEQQEYTKTIFDSGSHLLGVVNDILDLSSLEKGQMQIESARVVVSSLVESSCRPVRKMAVDKCLEFFVVVSPDVPEAIAGDVRRIRQILINLLGNAVKFTRKGSVALRVSPASLASRPVLDFSVADTGPGIPKETLPDLFEAFTQADSTVSRSFEGTGLGLAISLRLAEAMGGALDVVSSPGEGSSRSGPRHRRGRLFFKRGRAHSCRRR